VERATPNVARSTPKSPQITYPLVMAFFKRKSMTEKLETELAGLRARADTLSSRHAMARAALLEAKSKLQRHHLEDDLDADDKARTKLEAAVAACAVTRDGYADAMSEVKAKIADAEQWIAAERERIERDAAADKLTVQIAAVEAALSKTLQQSNALADALSAVGRLHFESGQMESFIRNVTSQIEIAGGFSLAELKGMATAIREGRQAIPRDEPQTDPVSVPEQVPPTQTVFMMRSANYRDHDGRKRFAGQYEDTIMPVPTAQRALRHGVAVSTADPRRAQLRGARGSDYKPNAADAIDLDAIEEPKSVPYNFVEIDRSAEARTIQISVSRV
jgi:hypothetical protein